MVTAVELRLSGYQIPIDDDALLSECTINTYRSSGKGGQHLNKTDSAVRLCHIPSGLVVTCQRERSQYRNKIIGAERLRSKLENELKEDAPRVATKVPFREKKKRLKQKVQRSGIKEQRRVPRVEE